MRFYKNEDFHSQEFYNAYVHESNALGALHGQDFYEITLTYSDNVVYNINGEKIYCPSGTLVFAHPGDQHCWRPTDGDSFSYFNLSFSPQTFEEILSYLGATDRRAYLIEGLHCVQLSTVDTDKLVGKLKRINSVEYGDKRNGRYYVKSLLAQVFSEFFLKEEHSAKVPKWLSDLCEWLKRDRNFALSLDEIAESVGKTKEHICRSVKRYMNVTVKQYVNEVRVAFVASMLEHTDIPVIDLWLSAGFCSGSYFNKLFKRRYNLTPQEYRKANCNAENQY